MSEFLVELFSEEIPARMQARAAEDLRHLVTEKLNAAGLTYGNADAFVTPRRLTLVVDDLPDKQPDATEERKGPRVGSPDKAVEGFMKANGLESIDEAEVRETEKGEFYFAVRHVPGRPTAEVLVDLLTESVHALGWPKSMRWGETKFRWVRPLHRVLALFAGKTLEGGLGLHGDKVAFTDSTIGHRFLAPDPVTVKNFDDYRKKLEKAYVVLDPAERRKRIEADVETLAGAEDLSLREDGGLMDEVIGLVEWPVVLMGEIDPEFMDLPPEVLTTSMRSHQKYFALEHEDGSLAPYFLVVANMPAEAESERRANIVAGNERVLRARLADAKFFWDQDRKTRLDNRVPQLQDVIFHARLGSMHHKVDRIESLALEIGHLLAKAERDHVRAAARLAKADLMTGMVGEFPELQGIMGKYYAADEGEPEDVARAIAEHYSPLGPNDSVPTAPVSVAVALADKIDTLAGFFAIGERPTGSKDPYALRRAALGIIRIIVENELRLPLAHVFAGAYRMLPSDAQQRLQSRVAVEATSGEELLEGEGRDHGGRKIGEPAADVVLHGERALATEVVAFLADRLKVVLRDRGVRHDLIAAVFAVEKTDGGPEDDLVRLLAKVRALDEFLGTDDGANLLVAYRRAANIVRIEAKKDDRSYTGEVQVDQLSEDEEKALHDALAKAVEKARGALEDEDFKAAMEVLAGLRKPVDDFFDTVTVNADDPALRRNRLRLLRRIEDTLEAVADFSKIEG